MPAPPPVADPAGRGVSLTNIQRDPEKEARERPLDFGLIRRLLRYTQPHARKRNWLLLTVFLRAIQLPLVAWTIGAVINGPIAQGAPFPTIVLGALGLLLLAAWTNFNFHFRQRLALELGETIVHDLQQQIFRHLQAMPLGWYNRTKIGRIISRVTSDCEAMRVGVQDVLFVTLVGAGQMLVSAGLMLYYDRVMFLVVLAMTPVMWGLNRYFRKRLSRAYRAIQESFSRITGTLAESVTGIRVTQGFVRQELNATLFGDLLRDHARYNMSAQRTAGVFLPLLETNAQLFIAALLLIGGYRVLYAEPGMAPGDLIQFFFLANIFFSPIQMLGNQYNQALTAMAGAERVFQLIDTPPDWTDSATARPLPAVRGEVTFERVTFAYQPDRPVLHAVDFRIAPGQTVALVGHTGSGKTTIISLLARFYLAQEGRVLIDGHDLREVTGNSLHHQMGLVLQQNFLFTGTVRENIRVGRPGATDAEIAEAARQLDCLDLFEKLSEGFDTVVGERGAKLSLGQRQLVCFTRAMLADPRILILDEATSAIDTLTELRIQKALTRLLAGRTSFVVAHRLSTIRHADVVLVLDQGHLVERGTHNELLTLGGKYSELCRSFIESPEGRAATEIAPSPTASAAGC